MTTDGHSYEGSLLTPGPGIWRTEVAHRFSVLMENEAYFDALASSIHKAERSIVVLGWQFDPRTHLDPETRPGDKAAEIGRQLRMLVKKKPDLDVRLLIWKSPLLIAASQGFYPHRAQRWFRKRMVEFRMDSPGPIGACHHQKVIVIDDRIAFVGGGDISTDRWDSEEHLDRDPRRALPNGAICKARHEMMSVFDGPAARVLGDLARERWFRATWERTVADDVASDPWPDNVPVHMTDVPVGVARTEPKWSGRHEVRENEALHLESIRRARRLIYMENQYFTSPVIAAALAARLAEEDGPEVVLITTAKSPSWFDSLTMDTARAEVLYRLESADRYNRFFAFAPLTEKGDRIIVHAKSTIIDDRLLRIGSTNLNNRSMGLDTECDIAVEPTDAAGRGVITAHRHHTISHWIGVGADDYAAVEAVMGSVGAAISSFKSPRLHLLGHDQPTRLQQLFAEWQLGDPISSSDAWRPWKRLAHARRPAPLPRTQTPD